MYELLICNLMRFLAMINGGLGETQVNGLLASLNIPTITQKSLKEREREVGSQLELMAEESCRQHLRKEIEMYICLYIDLYTLCLMGVHIPHRL